MRLDQVRVLDFVLHAPAAPPPGSVQTGAATAATAAAAPPAANARRSGTERVAAALAERVLEGLVLYQLPADKRAQLDQADVQVGALDITRNGLQITFAPKPK